MCYNCDRFGNCGFINVTGYGVKEYGSILGEA
jgi:hypothetical protein